MVEGARLEIAYTETYREFESLPLRQQIMALLMSEDDHRTRHRVIANILECIRNDRTIKLPPFDRLRDRPSDLFALQSVGLEPNDFGGKMGDFRFQFEGEDDLLHLFVVRNNGAEIAVSDAQQVCGNLLPGVAPALIWLKPGVYSHHFYVGHDELIATITLGEEPSTL